MKGIESQISMPFKVMKMKPKSGFVLGPVID